MVPCKLSEKVAVLQLMLPVKSFRNVLNLFLSSKALLFFVDWFAFLGLGTVKQWLMATWEWQRGYTGDLGIRLCFFVLVR